MVTSSPPRPRILVADDQPDVLAALRLLLKTEGYEIETANSPAVILSLLEAKNFDLALIDLNYTRDTTSGQEGLDLLSRLQAVDGTFPVVVMTAWEAWSWSWTPCVGARAISSRSRGTTPGCSLLCALRSS